MPASTPPLSPAEYRRYSRQIALPEIGESGQRRLKAASVLVVGAGGLGSPAATYLAAAGVGRITLADFDVVDASNLQRQILFSAADVGRPKSGAGADRLRALNPAIEVTALSERIATENAQRLVGAHDVVVDGSDNFGTRYLVSDACVLAGRPYVYGSIFRFEGQASVFHAPHGPCYRCLFPEPPPEGLVPNCAQAGVLGALAGVVGSIQAAETVKLLLGKGGTLAGRLLLVDLLAARFREVTLRRDPACPACGENPTITVAFEHAGPACASVPSVTAADLAAELGSGAAPLLVDVREEAEFAGGSIAGAQNVPLGELVTRVAELPRDRAIVVFCSVGPRGSRATELLASSGRERVRNLVGGLAAWEASRRR